MWYLEIVEYQEILVNTKFKEKVITYELAHVIMYNQDKYFYCANVVLMYNFTEIRRKIK